METQISIIINDGKNVFEIKLSKDYSGKVVLSFDRGSFQGGNKESRFVPQEVRSLKREDKT